MQKKGGGIVMKLVILDGYAENPGDLRWDALRRFGELTVYDRTNPDDAEEIDSTHMSIQDVVDYICGKVCN